jgi:hypothetical protein
MFAFKFYNNILGLNQRTVHFAINPVRHCQFCFAQGLANPPDESFVHLFSTCPTVTNWHNEFIHKHFNGINLDGQDRIKFWFLGILPLHEKPSFAVLSAILVFQFCIWEEKLRKRTPAFRTLNLLFEENFTSGFKSNGDFLKSAALLPHAIFRPLRGHAGPPP